MQNICMIDPRLATLRAFAACGTVLATAELTGFSPSAVSAQLRELQRSLGVTLLVKDGRGLRLTAAGRRLVQRSDALVEEWERIRAELLREGVQSPREFGIGGFSTAAANLLAPLAARLRERHAGVRTHVVEADPERCLELLVAERLDLAVVIAMQTKVDVSEAERFEQIQLLEDPLDVMLPATHRFADRESVRLEELAGEDWITDAVGGPYRALFAAAFTAAGITPHIAHEAIEWETAMALVGAGMGLGLVPRLVSVAAFDNVVRVRLSGAARPLRKVVAVVRRGGADAPLVGESLDILRSISTELMATRLAEEI